MQLSGQVSVVAGAVNDDVLSGKATWITLPWDAYVEFGFAVDALAANLVVDVYSGSDVILLGGQVSAQNRLPIYPDDFTLDDVAAAGERLVVRARNTHASTTIVLFFAVKVRPV